jgi:hypothetical protein
MLIGINIEDNKIKMNEKEISEKSFKELSLKEKDLEEFLRVNIDTVFDNETLLVIGHQVLDNQNGRSDLIAIDSNGNLVLIEIKRDKEDSHARKEPLELQAIRYAASLAMIKTPDELVDKIYQHYIEKFESKSNSELTSNERAKRNLDLFLKENNAINTFNNKQRIVLIASSFDEYTLSAVSWLIANKVDISCHSLEPIQIENDYFIEVTKILPPLKLEDYYTNIKSKNLKSENKTKSNITRTTLPKMAKLFEWGILKKDDEIKIKGYDESIATVIDSKKVLSDGIEIKYNDWGQNITGWSSINIYEWTILTRENKTLDELRREKMEILENES